MPEEKTTKVLAVASHVVYGYVGNAVTTFVLQLLGCEVSAINTVQFSNHTGYHQWKGERISPEELLDLFAGLQQSELDDFDMLLTGYVPGAEGVEAVGQIAKAMKARKRVDGEGKFFWVMDPVMGDEGKLYVSEHVVPVYKSLMPYADLITPNQYEVEWLTGLKINSTSDILSTIIALHDQYKISHILISSVQLASNNGQLVCAGSSITTNGKPRPFFLTLPMLEGPFVGTGDMFASLTVARFREQAELANVTNNDHWMSPDDVAATDLPLARAAEVIQGTMHKVLARTAVARDGKMMKIKQGEADEAMATKIMQTGESGDAKSVLKRVRYMKAAELQLVQSWKEIKEPETAYKAHEL